jgi:hypothetical protein
MEKQPTKKKGGRKQKNTEAAPAEGYAKHLQPAFDIAKRISGGVAGECFVHRGSVFRVAAAGSESLSPLLPLPLHSGLSIFIFD